MAPPSTVDVDLGRRSYRIEVGEGLLETAGALIKPLLAQPRVVVVTDSTVAPLYRAGLEESLDRAGIDHQWIVLAPGEQTKSFTHLSQLTDQLLALRVERNTTLVALGGGVIGDITGFAAAITLRGLDFVQIPTTLLAQVDSSVGGKTGINTSAGKNLVGAFHQPRLVIADTLVLDTLPRRDLLAGYAEVVKYGLIGDREFFDWLQENGRILIDGNSEARNQARRHAVVTSCRAKAAIVADDERERGRRALLNLGHTFGHALEAQAGYGDALLHGEAVAIGMVMAFDLSAGLGLCPPGDAKRVRRHLDDMGLPVGIGHLADGSWSAAGLLAHMGQDKKVSNGKLTFILARGIGESFITDEVRETDVAALLEEQLKS